MVIERKVINVYSDLNPWIDFIMDIEAPENVERAKGVIEQAFNEWLEDNEKVGDATVIEYISEKLKTENIGFEIYMKLEETEEE